MNILIWNGERHDGHLSYMYHPVVWTLTEALEESGCCNVTAGSGFGDLGLSAILHYSSRKGSIYFRRFGIVQSSPVEGAPRQRRALGLLQHGTSWLQARDHSLAD